MLSDKWFRIGMIAAVLGGLCCFTPLAVVAMTAIGLGAYTIWIDAVAMPLLLIGMGILIASILRLRQSKA